MISQEVDESLKQQFEGFLDLTIKEFHSQSKVKVLDLSNLDINDSMLNILIQKLASANILHLNLDNNKISSKGFVKLLSKLKNLKSISVANNEINKFQITLFNQLDNAHKIKRINLSSNRINFKDFIEISCLLCNLGLSELNLSNNNINGLPKDYYSKNNNAFFSAKNVSLSCKRINLSYNNIKNNDLGDIIDLIAYTENLNLSYNQLDGNIPDSFFQSIFTKYYNELELNLSGNKLFSLAGCGLLIKMLFRDKYAYEVEEKDFNNKKIKKTVYEPLKLKKLVLNNCGLLKEDCRSFLKEAIAVSNISVLDLDNNLVNEYYKDIVKGLEDNIRQLVIKKLTVRERIKKFSKSNIAHEEEQNNSLSFISLRPRLLNNSRFTTYDIRYFDKWESHIAELLCLKSNIIYNRIEIPNHITLKDAKNPEFNVIESLKIRESICRGIC